ncbi:MAG TPA: TPM domain-containing protein [Thermoanaerobaculia bacterium]|nr:TPM domain-containing protein [Thermoanaerobaculia bacterium]
MGPWLALYLAIAGGYYLALRGYGTEIATRGALVMAIFVLLAIGAVRSILRSREDHGLVSAALAGKPPADGQRSAVVGTLQTLGPALTSPFSRTLCASYSYKISHREKVETDEGPVTRTRTDFIGSATAPLIVRTRTGEVRLSPNHMPQGFLPTHLEEPSHYAHAGDYLQVTRFVDRSGWKMADAVSDVYAWNASAARDGELRSDWRTTAEGAGFILDPGKHTLEETIIPPGERVCAIGLYRAAQRELVPQPRKVLKLIRGNPFGVIAHTKSAMRQKLGAAIFLLIASHAGLAVWLGMAAADARREQAATAQTTAPPSPSPSSDVRAAVPSPARVAPAAREIPSPRPNGWCVDLSGRIPRETLAQIDRLGDAVKARRNGEIAVLVVGTMRNAPSQTLSSELFKAWRVSERGIFLLVSLDDQRVELLLGRDVGTPVNSRVSLEIVRDVISPRLRAADPGGAVLAGVSTAARRMFDLSAEVDGR